MRPLLLVAMSRGEGTGLIQLCNLSKAPRLSGSACLACWLLDALTAINSIPFFSAGARLRVELTPDTRRRAALLCAEEEPVPKEARRKPYSAELLLSIVSPAARVTIAFFHWRVCPPADNVHACSLLNRKCVYLGDVYREELQPGSNFSPRYEQPQSVSSAPSDRRKHVLKR